MNHWVWLKHFLCFQLFMLFLPISTHWQEIVCGISLKTLFWAPTVILITIFEDKLLNENVHSIVFLVVLSYYLEIRMSLLWNMLRFTLVKSTQLQMLVVLSTNDTNENKT
jgi:hypothetical protein